MGLMDTIKKRSGLAWVFLALLLAGWTCLPARITAATLDWSAVTWTSGSTANSYNVTGDGSYDIRVTITGGSYVLSSPLVSNIAPGNTGGDTLLMAVNWANNTSTLNITIDFFNSGASNVSFTLTDIDRNTGGDGTGWRDYITGIKARDAVTGTYVGPTSLTGSANNTVTSSGTNSTVRGNAQVSDGSADATINFGTNLINQVQFTYGNWTGFNPAPANPGQQYVGIGDITFTAKLPEVHPALAASLMCLIPMALRCCRRRRN
jgi:hypothetical protein